MNASHEGFRVSPDLSSYTMVIYDFVCSGGHRFEGWFDSLEECTRQESEGLLRCPVCDTSDLRRELAAPAVHLDKSAASPNSAAVPTPSGYSQTVLRAVTTAIRETLESHCDDVGPRFAEEAISIHLGESKARAIYGTSSDTEREELDDLGVKYQRIALPTFDD